MKFISKYQNYRIILRQGIPGNTVLGTPTISSISVLFQDNVAEVNDEKYIKMMLEHPRFGDDNSADFQIMEESDVESAYKFGKGGEPEHNIIEIDHGTTSKVINPKSITKINEEQKEYMRKTAKEMAMLMYADMVKKKKESEVSGDISTPVINSVSTPESITVSSSNQVNKIENDDKLKAPAPIEDTKPGMVVESEVPIREQSTSEITGEIIEKEVKVGGIEISSDNGEKTIRVDKNNNQIQETTQSQEIKKKPGRPKGSINNNK